MARNQQGRESFLKYYITSENFVLKYGFTEKRYNIFFGLNRKTASAVKRNKVKRIFRDNLKNEVENIDYLFSKGMSVCLISKKKLKIKSMKYINEILKKEFIEIINNFNKYSRSVIKKNIEDFDIHL